MYEFGPARELEYLLSGQSFAQLMTRWDFLNMVAEQDRVLLEGVRAQKEQVEQNQQQLVGNLQEVKHHRQNAPRASPTKLANLRQQKASQVASIQSQRQEYEAAAAELERTARRIQTLLAQLERRRREENDRARVEGRNPQPYSGDFARGQGQLEWPVRGELVGHFGLETHPAVRDADPQRRHRHRRAHRHARARRGQGPRRLRQRRLRGHGRHDRAQPRRRLLHAVRPPERGARAERARKCCPAPIIGKVGDVGSLKGPILHFEVRKGSGPLNPESLAALSLASHVHAGETCMKTIGSYAFEVTTSLSQDDAIARVTELLAEQGFGVRHRDRRAGHAAKKLDRRDAARTGSWARATRSSRIAR